MSQDKFLAFIIAFISIIALISFSLSPFFEVGKFEYTGLNNVSEDEVTEIVSSYNKANIIFLDQRGIERKLKEISYIKNVKIEKKYPDTLRIKVEEREPLAKINNHGQYLVFSKNGYIIEATSAQPDVSIPEIKGLGYTLDNNSLSFSPPLEDIVQAMEELDPEYRSEITLINYENDKFTAFLGEIPIYFGKQEEIMEKFRVFHSIMDKIDQENLEIEYIDLTISTRPVMKLK